MVKCCKKVLQSPMAMNYAYEQGKIKSGDMVLFDAFGGGLTWGSALFRFAPKN